jgi:ABC-type transport system involved in multi-copper enzyme maturation permease subunit
VHLRLGPGPVFVYEWLTTTRRWQLYALRSLFVWMILLGMAVIWQNELRHHGQRQTVSFQELASYGESFYKTMVVIELTLVLLVAPAATAGAVCLDKARGTLDHMLATDLSNAEIVLGKLGVRLVPVLGLIACALPVSALAGLLGGIDPVALAGSFLAAIGCAVLGCSLALTLSVWGRKTHEVLMMAYLLMILWISAPALLEVASYSLGLRLNPSMTMPALWEWAERSNPYYLAFAPYSNPGKIGWTTYLGFLGSCLFLSGLLAGLATLRIRGVAMSQAGRPAGGSRSRLGRLVPRLLRPAWLPHLPGPSLDGNPVLWREWHRSRPSWMMRVAWLLYSGFGVTWLVLTLQLVTSGRHDAGMLAAMNVFQVTVGLLLMSVSAATSLAEERASGSLDVLLTTPLATRTILAGKWWGAFRQVRYILVWPAAITGLLVAGTGRVIAFIGLLVLISAYGAAITSLGLALATWVSRLGRAVALTVAAYVGFSIGWVIFIFLLALPGRASDHFIVPSVMGSPLYGTAFATMVLEADPRFMPGGEGAVWLGTFFWISIHVGIAVALFAATVATFDRCLGRVSEISGRPISGAKKEPVAELEPYYVDGS